MSEPEVKKQKIENGANEASPLPEQALKPAILTQEAQEQLRESIRQSEPYKHGVIHGLLNDDLLRQARDEILEHLHFTQKETDIYKVNQTGDLANLSGLASDELSKLKAVAKVREGLYSKEFRDLMSFVTDCGPLSGKQQDLSINLYNKGCHLLNHDDVIGTRRISYILYLVPPDTPWDPKWGGALRLFPIEEPGIPAADFSKEIPPEWNQLSFFKVQPGYSFHDVEEVYVDQPRLSISGWFHIPQADEPGYDEDAFKEDDGSKATLAQLSGRGDSHVFEKYTEDESGELTDADKEYLGEFIDPKVMQNLPKYLDTFAESSVLTIPNFLLSDVFERIAAATEVDDLGKVPKTEKDLAAPWKLAKPSHIRHYMYLVAGGDEVPASDDLAAHVELQKVRDFIASPQFGRFVNAITSLAPTARYAEARRFRPGHDFTLATGLAHDALLEATLHLTSAKWTDDVGGYEMVMATEDNDDDPAVYRAAAESMVLHSSAPCANELNIYLREKEVLQFVKYVSRNAPSSRWDVSAEFEVEFDDDDDDE